MFDRFKKAFSRKKPDPEPMPGVFVATDDDRESAKMIDGMVAVQIALGGLDEDPGTWIRNERATVLGYIDGWAARWCTGLQKPERAELLSILAIELQFKGKRQMDVLANELWHLQSSKDPVFDKARRAGWEDMEGMFATPKRSPLALSGILLGQL